MKKLFLMAAAAVGLASATTAPETAAPAAPEAQARQATRATKPAKSSPREAPSSRQVEVKMAPRLPVEAPERYFRPVNQPRRVKYGKSRWIILA